MSRSGKSMAILLLFLTGMAPTSIADETGAWVVSTEIRERGQDDEGSDWRRTARGWERFSKFPRPLRHPIMAAVHPAVIAGLQLLASVGGMVLCADHSQPRQTSRAAASRRFAMLSRANVSTPGE